VGEGARPLLPAECEIWWAGPELARPAHLALLSATELERHDRLRRPADRARFTAAAALLRLVVSRHTGQDPAEVVVDRTCPDCEQMHGKPRLPGSRLGVSVSHAGGRVVIACGLDVELGVDVEEIQQHPELTALADLVLAESEAPSLRSLEGPERAHALLTYWTRKEAVLKTTGDGLRVPLRSITVSPPDRWPELLSYGSRPDLVGRLGLWPLDPGAGHVAAVGVLPTGGSPSVRPRVREFDGAVLLDGVA
jgi:4'-phosphopantetheinyl transferase